MPEVVAAPPVWKKDVQVFRASPVCRTHQEEHNFPNVTPFCEPWACGIGKCENPASYLVIY